MIGPSLFQPVGEQFDGLGAFTSQDEKAGCRSAKSTYHPENTFHCVDPFNFISTLRSFGSSCGLDAAKLRGVPLDEINLGGFRERDGNGYTLGYGFGSIWPCAWNRGPAGS
jgi:hypothetical protein